MCSAVQDLLKCTPDEILQLAMEKMHPSLDKAFAEAGMPIEASSVVAGNNLLVAGACFCYLLLTSTVNMTGVPMYTRVMLILAHLPQAQ